MTVQAQSKKGFPLTSATKKGARLRALSAQIERLKRRLQRFKQRDQRLSQSRQAMIVLGALLSLGLWQIQPLWGGLTLALTLLGFGGLVFCHRKLARGVRRHQRWLEIKSTHRARILLDWSSLAPSPWKADAEHPFAPDLHLVGLNSLHQLLDVAVSAGGSQRLKDWLLHTTPNREQVQKRQARVQELSPATLFRDKLLLHAGMTSKHQNNPWEGDSLIQWLKRHTQAKALPGLLVILTSLASLNALLFVLRQLALIPNYWIVSLIVYAGLYLWKQSKIAPVLNEASSLEQMMTQFVAAFRYLETCRYPRRPELAKLCAPFSDPVNRPSQQLNRLARISAAASVRSNPLVWLLLNLIVPWDLFFFQRLDRCKAALTQMLPSWFEVWYELEALCSLANFAHLNPDYAYAKIDAESDRSDSNILSARQIGHPLIPESQKVCNDFRVEKLGEVLLITGSNMSGKSTFLRTLGINLCLAYAGAPVNATSFQIPLLRVFTSIQVSDSLTAGFSYFYAEVRRLKQLLVELQKDHSLPLFFLIDEIFRGTNNRERLLGSRAYTRALVGQNGIGMISTHDLELVHLAEEFPQIANRHFRETVENGQMHFDYRIYDGPCPTTNALKIMQLQGLPVELPDDEIDQHSKPVILRQK